MQSLPSATVVAQLAVTTGQKAHARKHRARATRGDPAHGRVARRARGHQALRMRRADAVPRPTRRRAAAGDRGAGCVDPQGVPCRPRTRGRARRRHQPVRRGTARPEGRRALAREIPAHRRDRRAVAHGGRAAGRAQSRDLGGCRRATASTTRRIRRRRSRARSAATSPRMRAACIASSTDSPCTTCGACAASSSRARSSSSAATRSTAPATTCWR